ncbi:MAG: aminopeptidase P family protein [Lachnospiraceae bacterium]|nr:aminopeptidase P family protein [Lachnospiraceae bacterium]
MNNNRIDRVLAKMEEKNLTQMIVCDPMSIRYLTGIWVQPFERLYALLLKADGKHTFFLNHLFYIPKTPFIEVWYSDMDDYIGMIADAVDPEKPLGIDKEWPAKFLISLQERLPQMKTVLGSDCVDDCRAVKDAEEIELMTEASRINDVVIERAAAYVHDGITEKELADFIDAEYKKMGCSGNSFDTIVSFGPNAADQHHEPDSNAVLQDGQCVLIDMGCVWKNYCSDMTRTYYWKSVDDEQKKIHDLVREANEAAEAIIKPGVRFCDIDAEARKVINGAGYGEYWKIRLGHFIGQVDHEKGDVSPTNTAVAEPGMIFSIEPGIYIPDKYGVRIEDLVLVTEDGYQLLNHVDKKWKVLGE